MTQELEALITPLLKGGQYQVHDRHICRSCFCILHLQVYLGKWHGSEVAVKCLNPGLFFGGGELNDHAAVAGLVKEADMLGRSVRTYNF